MQLRCLSAISWVRRPAAIQPGVALASQCSYAFGFDTLVREGKHVWLCSWSARGSRSWRARVGRAKAASGVPRMLRSPVTSPR